MQLSGEKRARAKKCACGNASGERHAARPLRTASARLPLPAVFRTAAAASERNDLGTPRASDRTRAARGVLRNVLYPPKTSSPPRPESATFRPACLAAHETKYVLMPSAVG